jgi:signal transduction histidine kinase
MKDPQLDLLTDLTLAVAHDLNNCLNNILLQAAVLDQTKPELRPDTAVISQSARQAGNLVKKLQQVCQQHQPTLGAVDVNRLVREVAPEAAGGGGAQLHLELAEPLPPVLGTPEDVGLLVRLLVENAAACLGERGGRVTLRTEARSGSAILQVEDDGPAAEPDLLARLWEPFVRVRPGGDELRLSRCKGLVRRLQGSIRGENRSPGGMTFRVDFRPARVS